MTTTCNNKAIFMAFKDSSIEIFLHSRKVDLNTSMHVCLPSCPLQRQRLWSYDLTALYKSIIIIIIIAQQACMRVTGMVTAYDGPW